MSLGSRKKRSLELLRLRGGGNEEESFAEEDSLEMPAPRRATSDKSSAKTEDQVCQLKEVEKRTVPEDQSEPKPGPSGVRRSRSRNKIRPRAKSDGNSQRRRFKRITRVNDSTSSLEDYDERDTSEDDFEKRMAPSRERQKRAEDDTDSQTIILTSENEAAPNKEKGK